MCVSKILYNFCLKHFFILTRTERDMIENYVGLHVKYPLFWSDCKEFLIFLRDFETILKYQISCKSVQ